MNKGTLNRFAAEMTDEDWFDLGKSDAYWRKNGSAIDFSDKAPKNQQN